MPDPTPSAADRIADAVKARVEPLADYPVIVRDSPDRLDGDPPLVVVAVTDDDTAPADFDNDWVTYLAAVVLVTPTGAKARSAGANRRWRQAARRLLHVPELDGVPELVSCEVLPGRFAPRPGTNAQVNVTLLAVRYTTLEPRG